MNIKHYKQQIELIKKKSNFTIPKSKYNDPEYCKERRLILLLLASILQKHKEFIALKDKDKKELLNILKVNEDDSLNAFYVCKNCSYSERLTKRTNVLNKMYIGSVSGYNNADMFKYYVHDKTLPHTRDYVCRNKSCDTHKNPEKRDAKWFRTNQSSYTTYYVCTVCETVWNIS